MVIQPEMAIALTDFSGFCGFRPLPQIVAYLSSVPEFAAVVGHSATSRFLSATSSAPNSLLHKSPPAESPSPDYADLQKALRDLFSALMNADPEKAVKPQLKKLIQRYKKETGKRESKDMESNTIEELVVRLDEQFPEDIGAFCSFMLNIVNLKKGEAVFLKANEPHAYLSGGQWNLLLPKQSELKIRAYRYHRVHGYFGYVFASLPFPMCPELCSAHIDNVVRAGLTPKLRDVPTLTSMLTYTYGPSDSQLMVPKAFRPPSKHTTEYNPPIDEFSVLLTDTLSSGSDSHSALEGPSIVIITELKGRGLLKSDEGQMEVEREGQTFFVAARTKLTFEGKMVAYRAFVEVNQ